MNVILITICGLRPDHLGCYGNSRVRTPALDRFARESLIFDRACPETLPMLPARHALFTGKRLYPFRNTPSALGKKLPAAGSMPPVLAGLTLPGWGPIPTDTATVSEILHPRYRTALFSDAPPYFAWARMNYHRGFAHFDWIRGQILDEYGIPRPAGNIDMGRYLPSWFANDWYAQALPRYLANTVTWKAEEDHFAPRLFSKAARWLDDIRQATEPFFLVIDSWDPREPWDPPRHYIDLYDPGYRGLEMILPFYGPTRQMGEAELHHMRALYAAKVTMVDTWFGRFMDKVGQLGLLDNTLIIVTSDHGLQLGEHGISGECPAGMYPELIDCVLMVRHPRGRGAGRRSRALVQHQDVAATILGFLGVDPPSELDGFDLAPIIEGEDHRVRDYATCAYAMNLWCRDGEFVLICRTTGEEPQLYDLATDPLQMQNAAWDRPRVVKRMYDLMIEDAGGPMAPGYSLPNAKVHQGVRWLDWSPYRPFQMP